MVVSSIAEAGVLDDRAKCGAHIARRRVRVDALIEQRRFAAGLGSPVQVLKGESTGPELVIGRVDQGRDELRVIRDHPAVEQRLWALGGRLKNDRIRGTGPA